MYLSFVQDITKVVCHFGESRYWAWGLLGVFALPKVHPYSWLPHLWWVCTYIGASIRLLHLFPCSRVRALTYWNTSYFVINYFLKISYIYDIKYYIIFLNHEQASFIILKFHFRRVTGGKFVYSKYYWI